MDKLQGRAADRDTPAPCHHTETGPQRAGRTGTDRTRKRHTGSPRGCPRWGMGTTTRPPDPARCLPAPWAAPPEHIDRRRLRHRSRAAAAALREGAELRDDPRERARLRQPGKPSRRQDTPAHKAAAVLRPPGPGRSTAPPAQARKGSLHSTDRTSDHTRPPTGQSAASAAPDSLHRRSARRSLATHR